MKPLVARRPDLAFGKGCIVLQPVTHYCRFVTFMPSRWDKETFYPLCGVTQLFDRHEHLTILVSARYLHPLHPPRWDCTREGESELLIEHIEQHMLPSLEPVIDPEHHLIFANGHNDFRIGDVGLPAWLWTLDYCFAGRYEAAQHVLEGWLTDDLFSSALHRDEKNRINSRHTRKGEPCIPEHTWSTRLGDLLPPEARNDPRWFWQSAYLLQLLRNDRSGIVPLLHEWEEYSARRLKLEKCWHRTPFPTESVSSP